MMFLNTPKILITKTNQNLSKNCSFGIILIVRRDRFTLSFKSLRRF